MSKKIVLTGGPCAGKTTITQVIQNTFAKDLISVPEAASLIYRGGFPRWTDSHSLICIQRAIYHVQTELEEMYTAKYPNKNLVFDRGTIDGAAYWPKGGEDFFKTLNTSLDIEMKRYDLIIFLESLESNLYEQHVAINPTRTESWDEAQKLDQLTLSLWQKHPHFFKVKSFSSFQDKINTVIELIKNVIST